MAKRRLLSGTSTPPPSTNLLLAALPAADYARITPLLATVPLKLQEPIHKPGEAIRHVYFPGGGFCSVLTVLEDGTMVEVATIGREGAVGVSAIFDGDGDGTAPRSLSMVQAASDTCFRMPVELFRQEMDRRGAFYELLARYTQALLGLIMQSTACNAVHTVEQRLARWFLMAHDRVGTDSFPLTQEFVAMMLGVARPTVTIVAGTLQKAGLITYQRGHVTVLDREKLEAASCECYRTVASLLKNVTAGRRSSSKLR
jgi:CRP-like cAMP-binding protein